MNHPMKKVEKGDDKAVKFREDAQNKAESSQCSAPFGPWIRMDHDQGTPSKTFAARGRLAAWVSVASAASTWGVHHDPYTSMRPTKIMEDRWPTDYGAG